MSDLLWLPDWLRDMAPLVPIAPAFFFPTCQCCGDGIDLVDTSHCCLPCPALPRCWELTVAGVTDDDCTLCSNANGTFILTYTASNNCTYRSPTFPVKFKALGVCVDRSGFWELKLNSVALVPELELVVGGGVFLSYYQYLAGFSNLNCDGANVFDFNQKNDACTSWPATLTVTPTTCV